MKKEYETMWFITVFEKVDRDEQGWPALGATRTWGFYSDRSVAIKALHENWTDMHEGLYNYAVIEGYDEGICHCHNPDETKWFKWDEEMEGYREIERPEVVDNFSDFAIG